MSVMTRKDVRHKLMTERVLNKIEREHLPLNTPRVLSNLDSIRSQVTGPSMVKAITTWEQLLRSGDIHKVRRLTGMDTPDSQLLRSLSPLGILLSEQERRQVLSKLSNQMLATHRTATRRRTPIAA
ncbi:hypothetical protein GFY24_38935 [Nocardia sp. SYP-A9097]|uniref:hypothetical protein n=1 Tax=Nocardia sp. SYP-A9097 TaxID=2663237 RepID=UPI00129AA9BA|nr:hypothetical protein [Nocardia sp. SYP-A9097]MRH93326.1 hypothetical protein [Nocardia sp. SYP-A9097]